MLSRMRTEALAWYHNTVLPATPSQTGAPTIHNWHRHCNGRWISDSSVTNAKNTKPHTFPAMDYIRIITWNIDASSPSQGSRISALLGAMISRQDNPDVIFFQEVSDTALHTLLAHPSLQQDWLSSDADTSKFGKRDFGTVTLISKIFLATTVFSVGPVFRVPLPSHFDRYALCCDLMIDKSALHPASIDPTTPIRLINVHLDSLPINPSMRPQQLYIVSEYLRAAGRGLVAGDFNPVFPEDDALVSENGLEDAWVKLYPTDPGYTWGWKSDQPFPPNRMDKMALYNVTPVRMWVLPVCDAGEEGKELIPCSDHLGFLISFPKVWTAPSSSALEGWG